MVNRLWQWHFGRGIVGSPNDFGRQGQPPTHPELLDWLATEFVARGWSLKSMHRLIMTSHVYKMSSQFSDEENLAINGENRYLWRANRRRLEAETVWDAIHSAAGTLNLKMGGGLSRPHSRTPSLRPCVTNGGGRCRPIRRIIRGGASTCWRAARFHSRCSTSSTRRIRLSAARAGK